MTYVVLVNSEQGSQSEKVALSDLALIGIIVTTLDLILTKSPKNSESSTRRIRWTSNRWTPWKGVSRSQLGLKNQHQGSWRDS